MKQAFDGIIYDTDTATLLGRDLPDFLGRTRCLYRTPESSYFLYQVTVSSRCAGVVRRDPKMTALTISQAIPEYNLLEERELDFDEAFPDTDFIKA